MGSSMRRSWRRRELMAFPLHTGASMSVQDLGMPQTSRIRSRHGAKRFRKRATEAAFSILRRCAEAAQGLYYKMLDVPSSEASHSGHVRRRPLSGGARHRGWADVRELDGAKYMVDLNSTVHLDWDEWQRLCAAEPTQTEAPMWYLLSTTSTSDDDAQTEDEEEHPVEASLERNQAQRFVRRQPLTEHNAPPAAPTA